MTESQKSFMYIFRDVKTPGKTQIGLTSLQWGMGSLEISHSGNMGNTIMRSVDPNLENIGFPSIEDLRATFRVIEENGSPDYHWYILFDLTKPA